MLGARYFGRRYFGRRYFGTRPGVSLALRAVVVTGFTMTPAPICLTRPTVVDVSGLDDLQFSATLTEPDDTPIDTATVRVLLCAADTATLLAVGATVELTHDGAGAWSGTLDNADAATAITTLAMGQRFDILLEVEDCYMRRHYRARRVAVVDAAPE